MPMRFQHAPHVKNAPILEAHGLTVRFGRHVALDRLTFALQPGDQVAVVGPNGAGKSTLFKAIAGLLEPGEGILTVFGHRPSGHSCIAYVPQRSQVDWNFPATVREVVQMGRVGKLGLFRRPAPADRAKVDECLREVGLLELADRQLSELSGGQQQRMFIARALAMEAELMLLDEPFSALDLVTQQEVLALVLGLRAQGVTVLVALHDLNLAATRFNRVLLLRNRAIGFGHPDEVLTGPHLQAAYGDTARVIPTGEGRVFVGDTCCGGGHDHA